MGAARGNTEVEHAAEKPASTVTAPKALIFLLLVGGSGDAMSKIYEELGNPKYNSQFLLYTFAMALVLCTLTAVLKGQKLTREDVLFGCLIGIPNYYSARFLLMSLSYVPAVIAYPTYSTGTIVLVGIAGVLFFREKMTSRQWVTVGMIAAALLMLNM
jgi:multidrug transporter EmrE-like cation transporter